MRDRIAATCLILFILLLGIAFCAILPPFEGHDEQGHYSSIRQIADTGILPTPEHGKLDKNVESYAKNGPLFYPSKPKYNKGRTFYPAFFEKHELVKNYVTLYREEGKDFSYKAGKKLNWQVQHPPLYYLLLAPVARAIEGQSFFTQFFVLRVFSYLLAFSGLLIGLWGTLSFMRRHLEKTPILLSPKIADSFPFVMDNCGPTAQRFVLFSFLLYPVFFPQFFPEFARLGNDSLCLFLFACFWSLLLRWFDDEENGTLTFFTGFALALGFLTKALFLPVAGGLLAFLSFRLFKDRADKEIRTQRFDAIILMFLPVLFASFWYLYEIKSTGTFIGHAEYKMVEEAGGFLPQILKNVTLHNFFFGLYALPVTFLWTGTASLARLAHYIQMPMMLFMFYLTARYLWRLRHSRWDSLAWLPLWFVLPFAAGLLHHMLTIIALEGNGGTPAWYGHILLPALAFAFALGFKHIWPRKIARLPFIGLSLYGVFFLLLSFWSLLPVYAGFAVPDKLSKLTHFSSQPLDLSRFGQIFDRLSVISWPELSLLSAGVAFLLLGLGMAFLLPFLEEKGQRGGKN